VAVFSGRFLQYEAYSTKLSAPNCLRLQFKLKPFIVRSAALCVCDHAWLVRGVVVASVPGSGSFLLVRGAWLVRGVVVASVPGSWEWCSTSAQHSDSARSLIASAQIRCRPQGGPMTKTGMRWMMEKAGSLAELTKENFDPASLEVSEHAPTCEHGIEIKPRSLACSCFAYLSLPTTLFSSY
jgi:hypothetical protein